MAKSPDAFRTISEVAELLQTPTHVLRFWESRFTQIRPVKRAGGRRYYRPTDVALLAGIRKLLHDDGLTIRGVQKILREQGVRHVCALAGDVLTAEAAREWGDVDAAAAAITAAPPEPEDRVIPWPGPKDAARGGDPVDAEGGGAAGPPGPVPDDSEAMPGFDADAVGGDAALDQMAEEPMAAAPARPPDSAMAEEAEPAAAWGGDAAIATESPVPSQDADAEDAVSAMMTVADAGPFGDTSAGENASFDEAAGSPSPMAPLDPATAHPDTMAADMAEGELAPIPTADPVAPVTASADAMDAPPEADEPVPESAMATATDPSSPADAMTEGLEAGLMADTAAAEGTGELPPPGRQPDDSENPASEDPLTIDALAAPWSQAAPADPDPLDTPEPAPRAKPRIIRRGTAALDDLPLFGGLFDAAPPPGTEEAATAAPANPEPVVSDAPIPAPQPVAAAPDLRHLAARLHALPPETPLPGLPALLERMRALRARLGDPSPGADL